MRSERMIFGVMAALMVAACGEGSAPPKPHVESATSQSATNESRVVTINEHMSAAQLHQSFLSGDLTRVHHDVSAMLTSRDAEALSYLQSVWALDPKVVGELNEAFVRSDAVRAYIANVLAQMAGNRMVNVDLGPLREALRVGLSLPDRDVKFRSADGLSYIAEDADVDRFVGLAEGSDVPLAKVAVTALANTCGQYAAEKLDGYINQARNPEVKQIAESMRSQLKAATAARCTGNG